MDNASRQPPTPESYPPSPPDGFSASPPAVYPYGPGWGYPPSPPPPPRLLPKDAYTSWVSRLLAFLCYRQGKTGQSIGKSVLKFMVINEKTWQPIGFWLSLVRQIAHYADPIVCYIGYLLP